MGRRHWSFLAVVALPGVRAACPYAAASGPLAHNPHHDMGPSPKDAAQEAQQGQASSSSSSSKTAQHQAYLKTLETTVNFTEVTAFIESFLVTSQPQWPADYGNYGPLFVRLAWHNAGSYRTSDGRGGVDGARQRFDPERSWADNTNLDKARALLFDVKLQFPELSWGDLIVLAGTVAVESMGGPRLGFCAGRVDDPDGSDSILLGPSSEQEAYAPCPVNGTCQSPLGSTTIGLIYLNPEGPMGEPDAVGSSMDVRDSFGRMAMNDSETVALIGGGHAFGKTHGACPDGAGPSPQEDPANPWPGLCGTGKGVDTFTSGIEGPWTTKPTTWDNEYFQNLIDFDWVSQKGPGDAWQWETLQEDDNPIAPAANVTVPASSANFTQKTMMLTSDISLKTDPDYLQIVTDFALSLDKFDAAFSAAWYKLMTRDMGPVYRCAKTPLLPKGPPPEFQYYLPKSNESDNIDFDAVQDALVTLFSYHVPDGPAISLQLAYACASTFRYTDYLGGCNGARLMYAPGKQFFGYETIVDNGVALLTPIYGQFDGISWADLIILAGQVALTSTLGGSFATPPTFCSGRVDDTKGEAWQYLTPVINGFVNETAAMLKESISRTGLSNRDYVSLLGARRSLGNLSSPFYGATSSNPSVLDNTYFLDLLKNDYEPFVVPSNPGNNESLTQYKAKDADLYATSTDLNCKYDAELGAIVMEYATDNARFLADLAQAWTNLVNADRFDKPECLPGV